MRVFHVGADRFVELEELPDTLPAAGFIWIGSARREFEVNAPRIQARLQAWNCGQLVDLHVSDLLNQALPSNFDSTSWYDFLVFRRLAIGAGSEALTADDALSTPAAARKALDSIDTSPVGFAVFDRVLLTCTRQTARCATISRSACCNRPAAARRAARRGCRPARPT
jgi:magnesium transporter